jgi:hypothetical protein
VSSSAIPLDPRLLELLSAVGKQSESVLFNYTRGDPTCLPAHNEVRATGFTAGLSPAEHELLRTHREDLAKLLLEVALTKLCDLAESRVIYVHPRPSAESLLQRSKVSVRQCASLEMMDDRAPAIARLLIGAETPEVSVAQIVVASLRLRERPSARVYLAHDALYRNEPHSALQLARQVASHERDPHTLCNALELAGAALGDLGRAAEALTCYQKAHFVASRAKLAGRIIIVSALNAVLHALIVGDAVALRKYGAQVHESLPGSADLVQGIVAPYKRDALWAAGEASSLHSSFARFQGLLSDDVAEVVYGAIAV